MPARSSTLRGAYWGPAPRFYGLLWYLRSVPLRFFFILTPYAGWTSPTDGWVSLIIFDALPPLAPPAPLPVGPLARWPESALPSPYKSVSSLPKADAISWLGLSYPPPLSSFIFCSLLYISLCTTSVRSLLSSVLAPLVPRFAKLPGSRFFTCMTFPLKSKAMFISAILSGPFPLFLIFVFSFSSYSLYIFASRAYSNSRLYSASFCN